ncbi:hypothetical protein VTJ04DRAFT_7357 [Mycothermus thermophilus]|uniref:uncharacterized protein n=1 Tax=Humicola insolens TaxID=85995 RepID=UPI0037423E52
MDGSGFFCCCNIFPWDFGVYSGFWLWALAFWGVVMISGWNGSESWVLLRPSFFSSCVLFFSIFYSLSVCNSGREEWKAGSECWIAQPH